MRAEALRTSRMLRLQLPGDVPLEAFIAVEPDARFALHWHAEWSVGAILEGHCEFACDGAHHRAAPGDVVLMPPGMPHTAGVSAQGFRMVMLYVPHAWVAAQLGWPARQRARVVAPSLHDPASTQSLAAAVQRGDGARVAALVAHIVRRQTDAARVPLSRAVDDARVARICALLEGEDACRIDPAALARREGLSREHFQRLFRRTVGVTPAHYTRLARIARAKALLGAGTAVADAALQCGFTDQAHFARWFRRCFGMPPGRYASG